MDFSTIVLKDRVHAKTPRRSWYDMFSLFIQRIFIRARKVRMASFALHGVLT
jgi:hypothetical protein